MSAVSPRTSQALATALKDQACAQEVLNVLESANVLSSDEAGFLDGSVAGTPAASKCVVLSSGGDVGTVGALTVDTSDTLAVTTADKLTVGGVIVPQGVTLADITISLSATKVIYNLFVARDAWQVTHIDYTPDVSQGGALTATVVKAITTATPASATTPMHAAGAITLTATTADLQLAAGNRIGLVLSGAMTVGSGKITVRGKRI